MNKLLLIITLFLPFTLNAENVQPLDSEQMDNIIETLEMLNCTKKVEGVEIICTEKEIPGEVRALEQQIREKEQKAYLEHLRYMDQQKDERQMLKDKVKALNMEQLKIKNNQETKTLENLQ